MDKYYETSFKRVIAYVPFLTICLEFRVENSKRFFTLWFVQHGEGIVLQANFFNFFTSNFYTTIFLLVLVFEIAGVWIFSEDLFLQVKEILRQNKPKNPEQYFDFLFPSKFVFAENLKFCKIAKFHTRENIETREKGVRISMLSGGDASSALVLVSKATFTFWSPPQYPPPRRLAPTLKQWGGKGLTPPPVLMAL